MGNLAQKIARNGVFFEQQAWPIIRDVYHGLTYLHSKNVIHRDIKTANIFIKDGVAKIADFGFAVQGKYTSSYSRTSFADLSIGSPIYMTP